MNELAINFTDNTKLEPYKKSKKIHAKTKGYSFDIWDRKWILDKNRTINLNFFMKI